MTSLLQRWLGSCIKNHVKSFLNECKLLVVLLFEDLSLLELHQLGEWWWHASVSLAIQVWGREWGYPQEGFPLNPICLFTKQEKKKNTKARKKQSQAGRTGGWCIKKNKWQVFLPTKNKGNSQPMGPTEQSLSAETQVPPHHVACSKRHQKLPKNSAQEGVAEQTIQEGVQLREES